MSSALEREIAATQSGGTLLAPPVGLEPTTPRLTAACSTIELRRNITGPNSTELRPVLAPPIFPGRHQPSIVGRSELNYRVRNGNGWTLALIGTNSIGALPLLYIHRQTPEDSLSTMELSLICHRVPAYRTRHAGPASWCTFTDSNRGPTD